MNGLVLDNDRIRFACPLRLSRGPGGMGTGGKNEMCTITLQSRANIFLEEIIHITPVAMLVLCGMTSRWTWQLLSPCHGT